MVAIVSADISPLLDSIVSGDEDHMISETLAFLGDQKVPPAKLAAHVGIPAAWAGGDGYALSTLSVSGLVSTWMRWVPMGPEPGEDNRRILEAALPLSQGFTAVASRLASGLVEPHPTLPEPLMPRDVQHPDGPLGALRDSLLSHDVQTVQRILLGYYASGTDYRNVLTAIYAALALRYPASGSPLCFAITGSRVLDMAEWGDKMPAFIYWFAPLLVEITPSTAAEDTAHAYAEEPGHDLTWLQTRLSVPNEEAAGADFQRTLVSGNAQQACEAALQALVHGATPTGVASGICLAAADVVNARPTGDAEGLYQAALTLLYAHSVRVATTQTQDPLIWPLLYTAASAVNSAHGALGSGAALAGSRSAPSTPVGGLIAASMLRTLGQLLRSGDSGGSLAVAHRYLQMGHPTRALAGVIASAAAGRDATPGKRNTFHPLVLATAAVEEYLALPPVLSTGGRNALLTAAIRLAGELNTGHQLADKVQRAIDGEIARQGTEKQAAR